MVILQLIGMIIFLVVIICSGIPMLLYFCFDKKSIAAPIGTIVLGVACLIMWITTKEEAWMKWGSIALIVGGTVWYMVYREKELNGAFKREKEQEQLQIEREREQVTASLNQTAPWAVKYMTEPCPYCGHYRVRYAKWDDKKMSIAFWGVASDKIGKNYKCEHCGKMWE